MFDVRYYMRQRGNENIVDMTKKTFNLCYDAETKMSYVKKVEDELTKNRREKDNELITGFMLQILDSDGTPHRLCPVQSFENYIGFLNEQSEYLWQKPNFKRYKAGQIPYYDNVRVGNNPYHLHL